MHDPAVEDLVGYSFCDAFGHILTVVGSARVPGMVELIGDDFYTMRSAAQLRQHRELERLLV